MFKRRGICEISETVEIGKMIGGWIKSIKKPAKKFSEANTSGERRRDYRSGVGGVPVHIRAVRVKTADIHNLPPESRLIILRFAVCAPPIRPDFVRRGLGCFDIIRAHSVNCFTCAGKLQVCFWRT